MDHTVPNRRWLRIIPPVMIVYIFAFMDRVNFGFAMAGGMTQELNISTTTAAFAAGVFFFGYLLFQVPGGHIAEKGYAKRFVALSILAGVGSQPSPAWSRQAGS